MAKGKIGSSERIDFYGFLVTLLETGKNVQGACEEVSEKISEKAQEWGVLAPMVERKGTLYADVAYGLRQGKALSQVLSGRVPDNEVMMLVAGGQGNMITALKAAEKEARNAKIMADTLTKGVAYPSLVFLGLLALMYWMGANLFPSFEGLIPVSEWASRSQRVYWLTTNIHVWVPVLAVVFATLGALGLWVHRHVMGRPREMFQWLPPFNIIRAMTGANLLSTLANLVLAGEPMKEALERMTRNSTSPYMAHYTGRALEQMRRGDASEGLGAALQMPIFDMWTQIKIDIYGRGESDEFTDNIERIADEARIKAQAKVSMIAQVLNFIMLATAGVLMIVAVMTMYSITDQLRSATGM